MRTLAPHFNDKGKAALDELSSFIKSCDRAEEMIVTWALELAFTDDAEAEAELAKASRELVETIRRNNPSLSASVVNGFAIALGEMIAARVNAFRSREGHA